LWQAKSPSRRLVNVVKGRKRLRRIAASVP
jgi:hypothetical protein